MNSLRSGLIRLAHARVDLRPVLLPLLKTADTMDNVSLLPEAQSLAAAIRQVDAPALGVSISALGGNHRPSVMIVVSFQPKSEWVNGILENSNYGRLSFDMDTHSMSLFTASGVTKFRKTRFKNEADAVAKLKKWIAENMAALGR